MDCLSLLAKASVNGNLQAQSSIVFAASCDGAKWGRPMTGVTHRLETVYVSKKYRRMWAIVDESDELRISFLASLRTAVLNPSMLSV